MAISDRFGGSGWRTVVALAWPYRRQFLVVAVFALLATGTDLLAPLIYREAVNDIAGLFVHSQTNVSVDSLLGMGDSGEAPPGLGSSAARPVLAANRGTAAPERRATQRAGREPHPRGRVRPKTSAPPVNTSTSPPVPLFL